MATSRRIDVGRASIIFVGALSVLGVFFFGWRVVNLSPGPGLDNGWSAALSMSVRFGVTFGNHIVFTYGPLGFLDVNQLWYGDTGQLAFAYLILVRIAAAVAIYAGARRSYGRIAGFLIAVVALALGEDLVNVTFLIAAVWVIQIQPSMRMRFLVIGLAGAIAAFELLIKISTGGELALMVVVLTLALEGSWLRHAAVAILSFAVVLVASWALAGQDLGALPAYVHNSIRIVSGYSSAMSVDEASIGWEYTGALFAFLFGLGAAWYATVSEPRRRRIGVLAMWTVFVFFEFKEGFQRHDTAHGGIYFSAVLAGFVAFRFRGGRRLIGVGLLGALATFTLAAHTLSASSVVDPFGNLDSAFAQFKEVFSARERRRIMLEGQASIFAGTRLDSETLDLLRGKTVHVAPYETTLVWAYGFHWRPIPVFQSYSAYTTGLDQLDANTVNSSEAPQRMLLYAGPGVDGRFQPFDEPLTERSILCRYQELSVDGGWDVLGVGPNRCGQPVFMSMVKAAWGQQVSVPAPPNDQTLVIARVSGVQVGGLERLRSALYKARVRLISLDGVSHRLVPETAADGLVLRASPGVDFAPPFEVAPNATSIAVTLEGSQPGGDPITYAFYEVPVSVGPRYPPLQRAIIHSTPIARSYLLGSR
jgi:hypothetical protein